MEQERNRGDELVADYLARVRAAAAGLDPGRGEELIEDLREHIAAARAELSPETEAGVRTLLDRLGDPAAIVAEASVGAPPVAPPPVTPPPAAAAPKSNRAAVTILITVLALVVLLPIVVCVGGGLFFYQVRSEPDSGPPEPVVSTIPVPRPS